MKNPIPVLILILALFNGAQYFSQNALKRPTDGLARSRELSGNALAKKVDALFAEWDKKDSPGVALGVIKDGKLIYNRGYGRADLGNNIPITSDTAFYIGSTSKQFTAFCIALLEEEGRLSVEDDVRKYLPELPQYEKPVTVRHLIHHLSGIRDYLALWDLSGRSFADSYPEEQALALVARQRSLNFTPGERYSYSNSNYFLLSLIVKRASGKSLHEFSDERIFKPLGMNNTHFHDDRTEIIKNRATGHVPKPGGGFSIYKSSFDLVGDGGVYTTVEDLLKWDRNFYHNKLGKGTQALIDRILTHGKVNDGRQIIYAWGVQRERYRGLRIAYHNGAFLGFRSELLRFPEQKFSVIILGNVQSVSASALATKVADIYLADLVKDEPKPGRGENNQKAETISTNLTEEELREFIGDFYSDELDVSYRLKISGEQLRYGVGYMPDSLLVFKEKNRFAADNISFVFYRDSQNNISGFGLSVNAIQNIRFVKRL